jgi:hypothetical protein
VPGPAGKETDEFERVLRAERGHLDRAEGAVGHGEQAVNHRSLRPVVVVCDVGAKDAAEDLKGKEFL